MHEPFSVIAPSSCRLSVEMDAELLIRDPCRAPGAGGTLYRRPEAAIDRSRQMLNDPRQMAVINAFACVDRPAD